MLDEPTGRQQDRRADRHAQLQPACDGIPHVLGLGGVPVGMLLWPAIAIHAVLTLLFAYVWFNDQQPKDRDLPSIPF